MLPRPRTALSLALAASLPYPTIPSAIAQSTDFRFGNPVRFMPQSGEALYADICQGCHMPGGVGAVGAGAYPALAKNPKNEEALVWHGSGLTFQAGQMFRAGDYANGKAAIIRGFREMDDAVALAPDSVAVLIPRGAALLGYATHSTDAARSRPQLEKALADYEKVLANQKPGWEKLPVHSRGELLSGLAEGWLRAGDAGKARGYAQRIVSDLPGSKYGARAQAFLAEANPPAQLDWQCIGCHAAHASP